MQCVCDSYIESWTLSLFYYYKYTKKFGIFNWNRDYSRLKKVLKQAGVVRNIK